MIRYGRCTRMHGAFLSPSQPLAFPRSHLISPPVVVLCFFLCLSCTFFLPLSVTHANTEVIISGRLGVKVRDDKHAAVVINFE